MMITLINYFRLPRSPQQDNERKQVVHNKRQIFVLKGTKLNNLFSINVFILSSFSQRNIISLQNNKKNYEKGKNIV